MKPRKLSILVVNWVSPCLSFFMSIPSAVPCMFTVPKCTTTKINLELCALNAEFQHFILSCNISYWDLIKCLYFADTTKRRDRKWQEAQRQGEDRYDTLWITLISGFTLGTHFVRSRSLYLYVNIYEKKWPLNKYMVYIKVMALFYYLVSNNPLEVQLK
jgi:hypothetical protein